MLLWYDTVIEASISEYHGFNSTPVRRYEFDKSALMLQVISQSWLQQDIQQQDTKMAGSGPR